jgi:hypothetical protein
MGFMSLMHLPFLLIILLVVLPQENSGYFMVLPPTILLLYCVEIVVWQRLDAESRRSPFLKMVGLAPITGAILVILLACCKRD